MEHNNDRRTLLAVTHNIVLFFFFYNFVVYISGAQGFDQLQKALLTQWLVYLVCVASPINANLKGVVKYVALLPLIVLIVLQFSIVANLDDIDKIMEVEATTMQHFLAIFLQLGCAFFSHLLTSLIKKDIRFFTTRQPGDA